MFPMNTMPGERDWDTFFIEHEEEVRKWDSDPSLPRRGEQHFEPLDGDFDRVIFHPDDDPGDFLITKCRQYTIELTVATDGETPIYDLSDGVNFISTRTWPESKTHLILLLAYAHESPVC